MHKTLFGTIIALSNYRRAETIDLVNSIRSDCGQYHGADLLSIPHASSLNSPLLTVSYIRSTLSEEDA